MGADFKETAFNNIDEKKYKSNYDKIFSKRVKTDCLHCGLSSRQKDKDFTCPHCKKDNNNET